MTQDQLFSLGRTALKVVGSVLLTLGIASAAQETTVLNSAESILGLAVTIYGIVRSWAAHVPPVVVPPVPAPQAAKACCTVKSPAKKK